MKKRKKILFLTTQLPYPPISGGVIKSWNLVDFFSKKHALTVACLLKGEDAENEQVFLKKVILSNYISQKITVKRSVLNLVKSYFKSESLTIFRHYSADFQEKINQLGTDFDVVFVDHYEVFQYLKLNYRGKIVFHQHNAEYVMWERFANTLSFPKKTIILNESKRILKAELNYCAKSDIILASPNDSKALAIKGAEIDKMRETIHLGEDFMLDYPAIQFADTEEALLYIGTLTWEANINGLLWFLKNCWEAIKEVKPAVVLYIVGKKPDERIVQAINNDKQVVLTGFVQNLEEYYSKSRVAIVPLKFGSGIKVKVLNAMYRGVPLVTTSIGIEGLKAINGTHLYSSESAEDFINKTIELLSNKKCWTNFRDNSRKLMQEHYTWEKHLKEINNWITD